MTIVDASRSRGDAADAECMRQRLVEGRQYLIEGSGVADGTSTIALLSELAYSVWNDPTESRVWLAFVVVSGAMPTADELLLLQRRLRAGNSSDAFLTVMECCLPAACREGGASRRIRIVADKPIVDTDFCARYGHNTGIQRVVRETLTRWVGDSRDFELAVWTEYGSMMRMASDAERALVLNWTSDMRHIRPGAHDLEDTTTIVPWRTTVVLPEVPNSRVTHELAALARYSGNFVAAVGYDTIPLLSADLVQVSASNQFSQYLSVIKHVDRVLAISDSAAREFEGFASAVRVQGINGPSVQSVALPVDSVTVGGVSPSVDQTGAASGRPVVLSVGTREFRKNQTTLLVAAELLWREGLDFELVFVGGDAIPLSGDFREVLAGLKRKKRPITILLNASDELLLEAYGRARFSVFVSLHEGYGLPVGESLAHGKPVLASNYGSVGDIADEGGCLMVDPRDIEAVRTGMRRLLTDDQLLESLRQEISRRPVRSWDDYADALWNAAVLPAGEAA